MAEYFDYNNIFLIKNITELLKYIKINNHAIKLEKAKQLFFKPIYSLESIELKIIKTYIETNLVSNFIWLSKFSIKASIFF